MVEELNTVLEKTNANNSGIILFHPVDDVLKSLLNDLIMDGVEYQIFDPRTDLDYRFWSLARATWRFSSNNLRLLIRHLIPKLKVRKVLRGIRAHLIADQLIESNPKAVITLIDNSALFHDVCEALPDVPFLAIQNGTRTVWCATDALPDPTDKYHIDEYFCFGPAVVELFEEFGHDIKKFTPCGSLLGGHFFSKCLDNGADEATTYHLCLISQWHEHHFTSPESLPEAWSRLGESIENLTKFVAKYADDHCVRVCVALRSCDPGEKEFYLKHFSKRVGFQEQNRAEGSSYQAVKRSELTIALNSTLALEAFGYGYKVLFTNPLDQNWLQPVRNGIYYMHQPTYESFSDRVSELLRMDVAEYLRIAESEMKHVMAFEKEMPAHHVIRERLRQFTRQ